MQMHPLPLLLCSLLFNHENNLPLSLSLFFSPLSIAIEKPRAPLLFSLSKKRMDSRTCSFMEYSQERECFALIKNRMELVSIIDLESRVYFRSTLRYHPNFNNNIQLDVLSRHLLRVISSTIFREICLVASFLQSGIREKCRAKFQSSIAKRPLMIIPPEKKMIHEEEWKIPISIEYEILDFKGFGSLIRGIFLLVVKSREFAKRGPSTLFESLHDSTISRRLFAHERVKNIRGRGGIDFPRIAKLD